MTITWRNPFRRDTAKSRAPVIVRDYDAGLISRLNNDWSSDGGYVPNTVAGELPRVVARCRNEVKNNPWLQHAVRMLVNNVVGPSGFTFTARAMDFKGVEDKRANQEITDAWTRWSTDPQLCDAAGKKTFRAHCRLAMKQWARDGEHIIRMIPGHNYPANPFAFALKAYNPTALDPTLNVAATRSGTAIINGIEVDTWGRPVAYYFRAKTNTDQIFGSDYVYYGADHERVPAAEIIHLFDADIEDAVRGYPMLASALSALHGLNEYEKSELIAARKDANRSSTYEAAAGDEDSPADEESLAEWIVKSEAGQDEVLPRGWSRHDNSPTRPNANMPQFSKHILRKVASAGGVGYNKLANDLEGVSYSSMREGTLEERNGYMDLQEVMIETICRRVYLEWLRAYLSFHPATTLPLGKIEKFSAHRWRGRRWSWIDPRSESAYYETCRKWGWKTDEDIAADIGEDFAENTNSIRRLDSKAQGTYLEANYATQQPPTP